MPVPLFYCKSYIRHVVRNTRGRCFTTRPFSSVRDREREAAHPDFLLWSVRAPNTSRAKVSLFTIRVLTEETAAETGRQIDFADGAISLTFGHSNSGATQALAQEGYCIIYILQLRKSDLIFRFCPKNFQSHTYCVYF
jgi:hypothetical protein